MTPILRTQSAMLALAIAIAQSACATSGATIGAVSPSNATVAGAARPVPTLARADSAWEAGSFLLANELYEAILAKDPSSHSAIFRLATLRSWDNRFDESIALFRRYVALEPNYTEGRLALARVIAWSGDYATSVAMYDSVLTREPGNRGAALGRAQTLAWSGQLDDALDAYKQWTVAHPTDREASMDYARALAWGGHLDTAEGLYTELSRTGNANAKKGLARVIGWRGDLQRSERTWRQVLVTDPTDPEALTGLAQVLSWQGRQGDAESALQLALRANPAYGDARALMRFVQADLRPSVTVAGIGGNDSDHNRSTSFLLDYAVGAPWNGTVGARYMERWANFATVDSRADAASAFARWQPAGTSWQFRADAGATRHTSTLVPTPARKQTIPSGALSASGNVARSLLIRVAASRAAFDETAMLIASGVVSSEFAGEAEIALPARFTLSGAASRARLTGGARENARNAFSSTLRWAHNRRWSLAVGARQFGYDTTSSDGYFAPKKYTLAEASGRGRVGGELGWNLVGDMGLGRQSIDFFGSSAGSRLAERAVLTAAYRFDPAHEFSASGWYANVAAPGQTGGSEYKAYTFSLRARVGF
ncbi:MAG TPA: tetratricopeptide repeat protein [Gemmatimonadaceae bacterium]|nr:tetratricopeptide repeat protein [Gemmatimonadaceae bacterium]